MEADLAIVASMQNAYSIYEHGVHNNCEAQLCTILYMEQTITPCMDLKSSLLRLLADYPNIDLHAMGFPQGWENEPLWR